jgi:hypothetical protein
LDGGRDRGACGGGLIYLGGFKVGSGFFKTRSGKIVCQWVTGGNPSAFMECGVSTGLRPPIPKTGAVCKHLDYVGNRVSAPVTCTTARP